jgi:hypothetical protein
MALDPSQLPDDVAALEAMLIAADKNARDLDAEIENLKLTIAKLQHERFGPSSERARLLDQLELQLGELVEHVAQTATADEIATAQSQTNQHHKPPRRKPARRPLPDNLPRERRVVRSPSSCPCCGGKTAQARFSVCQSGPAAGLMPGKASRAPPRHCRCFSVTDAPPNRLHRGRPSMPRAPERRKVTHNRFGKHASYRQLARCSGASGQAGEGRSASLELERASRPPVPRCRNISPATSMWCFPRSPAGANRLGVAADGSHDHSA